MWPRLRIDDVCTIVHFLGTMVLAIGVVMLIPLLVALLCNEPEPALDFFVGFGVAFVAGAAMRLVKPKRKGLTGMQALVITGLAWVAAALVSAVPFFVGGYFDTYFDAFFDSVSYYTDTGMALLQNLSHLPISFGLWRQIMLVIGAEGIVLVALGLGTISGFSGAGLLFEAEGHLDRISPRFADTSRLLAGILGAFIVFGTLVCTLLCRVLCGMSGLRALYHGFCLAAAAVSTGGLTAMDAGVGYYHQPILYAVLMVLMFAGIFSFVVYLRMAVKGPREFFRDIETRMILLWSFIIIILLSVAFAHDGYFGSIGTIIDKGLFNAASALTGTGFCSLTSTQLTGVASSGILFAYILAMSMGGATSSTAGGIKAIRMAIVFKSIASEVRRRLLPQHARSVIRYYHLGEQTLTDELSRNAMLVLLLFLVTYITGAIMGMLCGYSPLSAMLESVSCTNNCGISAGIIGEGLPTPLKITYLIQMLAGRLEFITFLSTITSLLVSVGRGCIDSKIGSAFIKRFPPSAALSVIPA
ncbi:MAG: TrkH family potassium uptake protein [Coriobacteriales bacterium]|nr:TrkH family potassium uptake protein [Coriobacteriales bacterium]